MNYLNEVDLFSAWMNNKSIVVILPDNAEERELNDFKELMNKELTINNIQLDNLSRFSSVDLPILVIYCTRGNYSDYAFMVTKERANVIINTDNINKLGNLVLWEDYLESKWNVGKETTTDSCICDNRQLKSVYIGPMVGYIRVCSNCKKEIM